MVTLDVVSDFRIEATTIRYVSLEKQEKTVTSIYNLTTPMESYIYIYREREIERERETEMYITSTLRKAI